MCEWLPALKAEEVEQEICNRFIVMTAALPRPLRAQEKLEVHQTSRLLIGVLSGAQPVAGLNTMDRTLLIRAQRVVGDLLLEDLRAKLRDGGGIHPQYVQDLLDPVIGTELNHPCPFENEAELNERIAYCSTLIALRGALLPLIGAQSLVVGDTQGKITRECSTLESHGRTLKNTHARITLQALIADLRSRGLS